MLGASSLILTMKIPSLHIQFTKSYEREKKHNENEIANSMTTVLDSNIPTYHTYPRIHMKDITQKINHN